MKYLLKLIHILRRKGGPRIYQPVILVTGCSSGIGLSIARMLWKLDYYRIVITARPQSLDKFQREHFQDNERFWILPLDVTSEASRQDLMHKIRERWGGVDILVNNAGISYRSVVEHMSEEDEQRQLNTNYLGPMALIRLVLPHMRLQGRGKIINVSSVSGMLAMPTMASYSASKHALEGASEALWYEMKPLGIDVTLIQPGFVRSNSFERVVYSKCAEIAERKNGPYSDYYRNMTPFVRRMMRLSKTPPSKIAKKVIQIIQTENPPLWVPVTVDAVIFYYLRRFLPRKYFHTILFYALPGARHWAKSYSKARV